MKSLTELNTVAGAPIEITDDRPATVIFDRLVLQDRIITVSSTTITATPQIEIEEIINYSTADVRYVATIYSPSATFRSNSTLTFATLPTGVTSTITTDTNKKIYTISGLKSDSDWSVVRAPTWTLPSNYATFPQWYLILQVIYYDQATDTEITRQWELYDPEYYPRAELESTAVLTGAVAKTVSVGAAVNSQFDLETDGPFKNFRASMTATATVSTTVVKFKGTIKNLQSTASITADLRRIRTAGKNLTSTFTITKNIIGTKEAFASQMTVVAGYIGPGGKVFLEGNGFAYATGLGFWPAGWPGVSRIRPGAANLTVAGFTLADGEDARLMAADLTSTATMTVEGTQFIGTVQNLSTTATMTTAAVVNRSAVSTQTVQAVITTNARADLVGVSTQQATITQQTQPLRIKTLDSDITTQSALSVISANSRIRFASKALSTSSSMTSIASAYGSMILTYNVSDVTYNGGSARTIYLAMDGQVNCSVNWGDGSSNTYNTSGIKSHTYATTGNKTVTISPVVFDNNPALEKFGSIPNPSPGNAYTGVGYRYFVSSSFGIDNNDRIAPANQQMFTGVTKWGHLGMTAIPGMFRPAQPPSSDGSTDSGYPTSVIVNLNPNISDTITDISWAFLPNISLVSNLNVSNVRKGQYAFSNRFNQSLSSWDVSRWTDMSLLFFQTTTFNQSLSTWNTGSATTMRSMFNGSDVFNQSLNSWNTANVTDMSYMFSNNTVYNQPMSSWNTANVTNMSFMFAGASSFNQDISAWQTGNVTNMDGMFVNASSFGFYSSTPPYPPTPVDLSGWCVSLIPTKPSSFDTGTHPIWPANKRPVWGTCP